jgi:uncharacterized tellurite resistance protein B-like protein
MSVLSRLRDLFEPVLGADAAIPESDARLTVAALLVLVARADGRMLAVEETGLHALLRSRFALSDDQIARILQQVDAMAGYDPAVTLAERILQDIAPDDRPGVMALAYRMAGLDGHFHEFEEDLLWRIGRLLGFADSDVTAIRDDALKNLAPEQARAP